MNAVDPAFAPFLNAIAPKPTPWTLDFENYENTNERVYFVMQGRLTIATCRRREDAERIVKDHNDA